MNNFPQSDAEELRYQPPSTFLWKSQTEGYYTMKNSHFTTWWNSTEKWGAINVKGTKMAISEPFSLGPECRQKQPLHKQNPLVGVQKGKKKNTHTGGKTFF